LDGLDHDNFSGRGLFLTAFFIVRRGRVIICKWIRRFLPLWIQDVMAFLAPKIENPPIGGFSLKLSNVPGGRLAPTNPRWLIGLI
jgi:hypothetical protein